MVKRGILNQPSFFLDRLIRHRWLLAGAGMLTTLAMMAATAVTRDTPPPADLQTRLVERLDLEGARPIDQGEALFLHEARIERGDTFDQLLARLGVLDEDARRFIRSAPELRQLHRQLIPGRVVSARTTESGQLVRLVFPLDNDTAHVVERRASGFAARETALRYETHPVLKSGEIRQTLFGATDSAGIPDAIAVQMAEIFSADIDFHRDLRRGDRFTLLYEMQYLDGQPARGGRILAAEFVNAGKTYQAFYHAENGSGAYYTADGKSRRKAFLRAPLAFSRVTSGFAMRFHPILQTWRAHKGVDYGAPVGTPVRATGDGVVEFIGRQGGYGNLLVLAHAGQYETAYGHLSAFAKGLRKGSRVAQGETIAYVGQSGWATGPHLHYEFRVKGKAVNPLALDLPTAQPLHGAEQARFLAEIRPRLALLREAGSMPALAFE